MLTKVFFKRWLLVVVILIFRLPCFGQSSTSFQLLRANMASGGGIIQSANLELTQSTIGGFAVGRSASSSFLLNGGTLVTSVDNGTLESTLPTSFLLLQNYPNPFNPETTIEYAVPKNSEVKVRIFNGLGQLVKTLDQGFQQAGHYRFKWDAKNEYGVQVSSGAYFYQMIASSFVDVRKMLLLR